VSFTRLSHEEHLPAHRALEDAAEVSRLACFGVEFTEESLGAMKSLRELATGIPRDDPLREKLREAGVRLIWQQSQGFWGQTVAEFALGLTLCGLRRIPQLHRNIISDLAVWDYRQADGVGRPEERGMQYGDDSRFTNGTLAGKRVRVVGAGNIGSRYADFCHYLGADVAVWDPFAKEPCFHRAGARREHFLERLVIDAEIFAPMVPLTPDTRGLVRAEHIQALPKGCLVVVVTRARICDCEVLYQRVLRDELAMAADVFDHEPIEIGNALLGRHNVVHTPHNAGRTKEANFRFAEMLADQFSPGLPAGG
jgi:phosphoglycerate dehydrogenase-like enzyme